MTTPSEDEILALAREWATELRKDYTYAEGNRDDWFATMPPEISAGWLKKAELLEGLTALIERHRAEVERLTLEVQVAEAAYEAADERAEAAESALAAANARINKLVIECGAYDDMLAAERKRYAEIEAAARETQQWLQRGDYYRALVSEPALRTALKARTP